MEVFADTSALFALLDADDEFHRPAAEVWVSFLESDQTLVTSNYVLVETFALVNRRLGRPATRTLQADLVPVLETIWVDEPVHHRAASALLMAPGRSLSLVDCVSFELMRARGIDAAFAFDNDFPDQGFEMVTDTIPGGE